MKKTRIYLTWFAAISVVGIAVFAITKGMNDVASACIGSLMIVVGGYQGSQAYTKGKYIQANPNDKKLQG